MITYIKKIKQICRNGTLREFLKEIGWIFSYSGKHKKQIFNYIFMGLAGSFMGLAGSVASKYLIDAVTGYQPGKITLIAFVLIGMAVGNIAFKAVSGMYFTKVGIKINQEIQAEVYHKFLNKEWEAISIYHSGDLLNRLNSDVNTIAACILGWIPSLVTQLITFSAVFVILLYYDVTMAGISILCAPVPILMSKVIMKHMRIYNQRMKQISSEMTVFEEESLQNIQIVKSFGLITLFGQQMKNIQSNFMNIAVKYNKFSAITSSLLSAAGLAASYAAFGWGIYRLWSGAITYGTMTLFLQLAGRLAGEFSNLAGLLPSIVEAATCSGRILAVLDLPEEEYKDNPIPSGHRTGNIEQGITLRLLNLDFTYKNNNKKVFQKVCFSAGPREMIAVTGPSGEGKTTFFRMLLGLLKPTAGEAKLSDTTGSQADISAGTREFFSYVPQGNTIFTGTIADNLRMVKQDAADDELIQALKAASAYEFIEKLPMGINTRIGEKGTGLSEGQVQRLAIARALLKDTPILLLDEATSALDIETEEKVLKGIMEYGKCKTCIIATHRSSILPICDRVYRIKNMQLTCVIRKRNDKIAADF